MVLFVGRDLAARARLEAACRRAGAELEVVPTWPHGEVSADVVVVDLDEAGIEGLKGRPAAGRVIGYFSHVDAATGAAAKAAGLETYPRGRFWRDLDSILFDREPKPSV